MESSYHVGDQVTATCISPKSYPPSVLTWYINRDSADPNYASSQSEGLFHFTSQSENRTEPGNFEDHVLRLRPRLKTSSEVGAINGQRFHEIHHHQRADPNLYSVVKLRFPIREKHLGTEDRLLSLKCTASVTDLYWRSTEVKTLIRPLHAWRFPSSNIAVKIPGFLENNFQHHLLAFIPMLAIMSER